MTLFQNSVLRNHLQNQIIALVLQFQRETTDREIDIMVYELYGLSDDEVAVVEKR